MSCIESNVLPANAPATRSTASATGPSVHLTFTDAPPEYCEVMTENFVDGNAAFSAARMSPAVSVAE